MTVDAAAPGLAAGPGPIPAWIDRITTLPPRVCSVLRWALLISLVAHFAAMPLILPKASDKLRREMEKSKNTYLAKMIQKERGKIRGNEIRSLVKPPPLPPDPQQYAQRAIADAATKGVVQVTSKLMPVELQDSMVKHIETTLADEIREMAEQMRKHELTPEQYKKKQGELQEKVFVAAQQFEEQVREEGQVHIATASVTDWYEKRVASQFKAMIRQGLFAENRGGRVSAQKPARLAVQPAGNRRRKSDSAAGSTPAAPPTGAFHNPVWNQVFARESAGFLRSGHDKRADALPYEATLDLLGWVTRNRFAGPIKGLPDEAKGRVQAAGNGQWSFPDVPSLAHAATVAFLLDERHKTWDQDCAGYFSRFYPHRTNEVAREKTAMDELWQNILPAAENYRRQAASGAAASVLAKAQEALLALVESLAERGEQTALRLGNPKEAQLDAVNRALRSRLVRGPFLDEIHTYLVEHIVQRVKPAVVNLAQNQFREGMVYSKEGVDKAIKEFGVTSVSLLRRDIAEALTAPLLQRGLFLVAANPYKSPLSAAGALPSDTDIVRDEQALAKAVSLLPAEDKTYVEKRSEAIKTEIEESIDRTIEQLLKLMVDKDGVLAREFYAKADTVDYTDRLQVRLELRNRALQGRGQDLGDIMEEGVPDTANPRVALVAAVEAGQVAVQAVLTSVHPDFYVTAGRSAQALRASPPFFGTAPPADWGFTTQVRVKPPFQSPAFEAIPFLATPPRLDGNLSDWGSIRPLLLQPPRGELPYLGREPIPLYAGWNYQGFFFGYHVDQPRRFFFRPSEYVRGADGVSLVKRAEGDSRWLLAGDCLVLCFDTFDTRVPIRGDSNTQEFWIMPAGTDSDPATPGGERFVASRRDAQTRTQFDNWPYCRCSVRTFPSQPAEGPDGTGPYRVMTSDASGYTVEVFLPRSLFHDPVLAPGWYVGFNGAVGIGALMSEKGRPSMGNYATFLRPGREFALQSPSTWGDLLLLGTDAEVTIRSAEDDWPAATGIVPGHSYLFTVVDPDHNVNPAAEDTALVSAEVLGDGGRVDDVEVFVLKETGNNTGVFRGMINTQPGAGRQAHGIVEVLPGKEVRFAYEDFGDAKGRRNVLHEIKLPVVSSVMNLAKG